MEERRRPVTVCVAGAFDPLHIGHLEHMRKARELGDRLVVILNSDEDVIRKRGVVFMPEGQRYLLIKSLRFVDDVVLCIDGDGTVANTIRMIAPSIFAKGGDRVPGNMPSEELKACAEVGCEIHYGVGGILSSSTDLLKRFRKYDGELKHNASGDFK